MVQMTEHRYRPEIDGLRAVAVIGVLLFHFGLGTSGGFVGVDVFFVISGFLITGILLRQFDEGGFSLRDFWARRVRRIVPAALVMVLVTLALGALLDAPPRYALLARSAMAHVLISSNIYFSRDGGYFAESSDLEALLHTWSLSVEEQFYVILPLLMVVLWRCGFGRKFGWVMVGLAVLSFVWSCFEVLGSPKQAFFLLPSRGWELLAGALLAMAPRCQLSRGCREVLSGGGLALVVGAMVWFDRETMFPGPWALVPVLGAVLLIYAGGESVVGRVLGWRPLVGIGLISYSLYLWHWPLVVYARVVTLELTWEWKLGLLVVSFVFGFLSWRWVERPFRSGNLLRTNARSLWFGLISAVTLYGVVLGIYLSGGLPIRLPKEMRLIYEDVSWNGGEYSSAKSLPVEIGLVERESVDFVLWGDSHGASSAQVIDEVSQEMGLHGRAFLNNGTPPVTGIWFADMEGADPAKMVALNERVLTDIIELKPRAVLLVGRWVARCEGYSKAEMRGEVESHRFITMVVDSEMKEPSFEDSSGALVRQLSAMNARLVEAGIQLILVQQVPESTVNGVASRFLSCHRSLGFGDFPQFTTTRAQYEERQGRTMASLARLADEGVLVVDPVGGFFGESQPLKIYGERAFYRDDDHLTRAGAQFYLRPFYERLMSDLVSEDGQ